MSRARIENLLAAYVNVLEQVARTWEKEYRDHLRVARLLRARWMGGESVQALRATLQVEYHLYLATPPPDAEEVGRNFRYLCDEAGVELPALRR